MNPFHSGFEFPKCLSFFNHNNFYSYRYHHEIQIQWPMKFSVPILLTVKDDTSHVLAVSVMQPWSIFQSLIFFIKFCEAFWRSWQVNSFFDFLIWWHPNLCCLGNQMILKTIPKSLIVKLPLQQQKEIFDVKHRFEASFYSEKQVFQNDVLWNNISWNILQWSWIAHLRKFHSLPVSTECQIKSNVHKSTFLSKISGWQNNQEITEILLTQNV